MMINPALLGGSLILVFTFALSSAALAAPDPCKGKNRDNPECNGGEEPLAPGSALVESVTVDWFNQKLVLRGSDLDTAGSYALGASAALATANVSPTELDIAFSSDLAAEVTARGSYNLVVDGTAQLTVFVESQIIDPGAAGCPCETDWDTELSALGLWGGQDTECIEVTGPAANDPADIAGTVLSDPLDDTVYPHFPIGASFYPGDPDNSVCRLVQVNGDATTAELVNSRINETQQAACATVLNSNVCSPP
jgi:hypothetical protein